MLHSLLKVHQKHILSHGWETNLNDLLTSRFRESVDSDSFRYVCLCDCFSLPSFLFYSRLLPKHEMSWEHNHSWRTLSSPGGKCWWERVVRTPAVLVSFSKPSWVTISSNESRRVTSNRNRRVLDGTPLNWLLTTDHTPRTTITNPKSEVVSDW